MRSRLPASVTVLAGLVLVSWSIWIPVELDRLWPFAVPGPKSWLAQGALVWGAILQPTLAYLAILALAVVAFRRRWRDLAASLVLSTALTVSLVTVLKQLIARQRPSKAWLGSLHFDASYPSGHAAAATALAIAVVSFTFCLTRRRRGSIVAALISAATAIAVMTGRLVLALHHVSDVIGGALVAAFCAALAATLTGTWANSRPTGPARSLVVICHGQRIRGRVALERYLAVEAARRGCPRPLWVETSADAAGGPQASEALADGADGVLIVGGDGTIREVLGSLAGQPVPAAIIPAGTGNLLAKNLGIPLDAARAVKLALDGKAAPFDLLKVEVAGQAPAWSAVFAGIGADAAVLADTSVQAKSAWGPLGYLLAGQRHLTASAFHATVAVDGGEAEESDPSLLLFGNLGSLHPGITLMPQADPTDARLEVLIATPRDAADVRAMITGVLLGREELPRVTRLSGRHVNVQVDSAPLMQLDGDVTGPAAQVTVSVAPGAVSLIRPAARALLR